MTVLTSVLRFEEREGPHWGASSRPSIKYSEWSALSGFTFIGYLRPLNWTCPLASPLPPPFLCPSGTFSLSGLAQLITSYHPSFTHIQNSKDLNAPIQVFIPGFAVLRFESLSTTSLCLQWIFLNTYGIFPDIRRCCILPLNVLKIPQAGSQPHIS